jgi:DNA invertase Pin-like site-specific DNA recombinase
MGYYTQEKFYKNEVLIYSRKSQSDDPSQTIEEVLQKHETMLQEYAERELGGRVPEENIYREVVSGESIDGRIEIKKVLARIEDPTIKAVLVIEPQRLSRGDLEDCGRLINSLRFTKTQVLTLMMTYDLENKMERKFFQDELMRGRDYLEYVKEILFRGRIASVKRGEFIAQSPPFGYRKVLKGDIRTLEPIEDQAEIVRLMFRLRAEGQGNTAIARHVNNMGVKTNNGVLWTKDTVDRVLHNRHYLGLVLYNQRKETPMLVNGEIKKRKLTQTEGVIVAEGKQPAIIDQDLWEAAHATFKAVPKTKVEKELKNPYSGVLRCAKCGRVLTRIVTHKGEQYVRYRCPNPVPCFASGRKMSADAAILAALELSELPALKLKVQNKEGDSAKIQERQLKKLEQQLVEYRAQEETQFELLEQKKYTQELFDRRNTALRQKMDDCVAQIAKVKAALPKSIDYAERVATLQSAIDALKDPKATATEQNRIIKTIVESIDYSGVEFDPDNPIRRGRVGQELPFTVVVKLKL